MKNVTIVDYGTSNIFSVMHAFSYCGANITLTSDPDKIAAADRLLVPGVGAFSRSINGIEDAGLTESIRAFFTSGQPLLGICVGMQMMFDSSEEFGIHPGISLLPGQIKAIPQYSSDGQSHKIPHIGWNTLSKPDHTNSWDGTILEGIKPRDAVYFVHSFTAWPNNENDRLADTDYHGCRIAAAVRRDNAYGCQFHPERSGPVGLKIIDTFLGL